MSINITAAMVKRRNSFLIILILTIGIAASNQLLAQAPANDNCSNAINIPIPSNGFGLGNFTSLQSDLTNATVQTSEAYAPAIFVAALDKKSVWYKFSIPTIRAVRVTLTQPGTTITAGNAGFAVYQTNGCLPTNANISSKLTPIVTFGNTYHPCVPAGDYLIQVSSKVAANGPITIAIEISDQTGAAYDHPNQAYAFGVAAVNGRKIDFDTECQSIEDATEVCAALFNKQDYHKSAWFTFTTPAYLDYLAVTLSGDGLTSYFPSGAFNVLKKFGYTLYKGNVVTTSYTTLPVVDGCDSMQTNGLQSAVQRYTCGDLQPNTTYSIQLFFHKDFKDKLRLGLITGGVAPTAAPLPVAGMPASNALGILTATAAGTTTTMFDNFGCNSRHSVSACGAAIPATGITFGGVKYNLSSFATFTLSGTAAIRFRPGMITCGPRPIIRLFKQSVTTNCASLDTANLVGTATFNTEIECLAPGNYVVQILGRDDPMPLTSYNYFTPTYNYDQCLFTNLGSRFRLDMEVYTRKAFNKYSLNVAGAFDSINRVGAVQQPLLNGIAYRSAPDTIGCQPTLRPFDTTCSPLNDKIIYRQLILADSGTVGFSDLTYSNNPPFRYKFYSGDANALATAQNVFNFPNKVTGIVPKSLCLDGLLYCANKTVCVTPGTYTFASMGSTGDVGRADRPTFTFVKTRTTYNSLQNALNMGSILDTLGPNGGSLRGKRDYWSCDDNAIPINGYSPCPLAGRPATKAIYRQFYLKQDAIVGFSNPGYGGWCVGQAYGTRTLFYGKATDGMAALSPVGNQWNCFSTASTTNNCAPLREGWYTIVSWGTGPNYDSTMRLTQTGGRYNGYVSYFDEFDITITPACPGPKFNRPYKASVTAVNTPHLIQWGTRTISTPVYPRTDTSFILPKESFNCTVDTPFASHPVVACEAGSNRVAYFVFRTTQVSFLQINTGGYFAAVFDKDVRTDSIQFATLKPIQQCNSSIGNIQFCNFQPGIYTLVIFAKDADICRSVAPSIFIDQVGYSRFDFASKAYDFGTVPPDAVYRFGKVGDINPLHPTRPASSDFIYCTTGAFATDPTNTACEVTVNGNIYSTANNQPLYDANFPQSSGKVARRNLWYTFVVDHPGTVRIKVENKTLQRALQPRFAVYTSDVDAALPFNAVQSGGLVDSTVTHGLKFVTMNFLTWFHCFNAPNNISFYRDPCTATPTRYYILVDNVNGIASEPGGQLPNTQIDVSIQFDSLNFIAPKFDYHYQANNIGTIGAGTFAGLQDNYSCATRSTPDPLSTSQNACNKTLWYKFNSTITGNVRYRIRIGAGVFYNDGDIQLHKETRPGDSTINSLKVQPRATVSTSTGLWSQSCVTTGTYYLILPGCTRINQYVIPEIEMIEQEGDFCSRAVSAAINGAGSATASVLVNCHTIGTDYGEFGPQLTCPQAALTGNYKSSWFKIDIGGTDTLDVTTFLVENTNAASSDIKYRLMTGDCGAMQEQSCVQDALTQNTYQCLVPGQSYYVQVFTPVLKSNIGVTGSIDLKLSAIVHADTCAPLATCLANANFDTAFNCSNSDSVKFVNFSTYGSNISYEWSFGYNGQTSTQVSPSFFYPALPASQSYTIKLVVINNGCLQKDSVSRAITIPGRPTINLGADIAQCNSTAPIVLRATSHTGATYLWQNNSIADTFRVTVAGNNNYRVAVTYNGCTRRDTIRVLISPISKRPLQQINLCTDSVLVNVRRGFGETYRWNTGATTQSIFMSTPGYYWVDITYFDCVYRDSFEVNNVNALRPFGGDTTVCLTNGGFILDATMAGAVSYSWQNNSTADTFRVTSAGQYRVTVNFGNCTIRDTITVLGYPVPLTEVTDTSICYGETFLLPWSIYVTTAGTYRDTLKFAGGCDSLIRRINLTVKAKPSIGSDTTICFAQGSYTINATSTGAAGYNWQDGTATATYTVTAPGLYWVQIDYGTCNARDSIVINNYAQPVITTTNTSICAGSLFTLPWGLVVQNAGVYMDTVISSGGICDSLVRVVNLTISIKPQLGDDATLAICNGGTVNLNSLFTTNALNANWTINGNPVANTAAVTASGTYRLIANNAGGCSDTALVVISVNDKPALGNDTAIGICNGSPVNLTTIYNLTGLTGSWTINGSAVNMPAAVTAAGIYQLTASNNAGCADTAKLTLSVSQKPFLGNDSSISVCPGDSINLNTVYNLAGYTFTWSLNGNTISNPIAIKLAGAYRLVVTNTAGCSDTAIVTLSLRAKPLLGNNISQAICEGSTADLNNLFTTTGFTTNWTFNGITVANTTVVTTAGQYQLIAINAAACSDTALVNVVVNPAPSLGNDTIITRCAGNNINLTNVYVATGLTTNWSLNTVTVNNPAAVNMPGRYQLVATSVAGCSDTAIVLFALNPKPVIGNDTTLAICEGSFANFDVLFNTTGFVVNWSTNGTLITNTAAINKAGIYRLIATNLFGCADTAEVLLRVNSKPAIGRDSTIGICEGISLNLNNIYTTGNTNNSWISNGVPVNNPSAVNTSGIYQLVSSTAAGCADTAFVTIIVTGKPSVVVNQPATICLPQTANLTAAAITAGSATGLTFTYWRNVAGTIPYNNPAEATTGLYYIKGTTSTGCFDVKSVTITNYPIHSINAGNDKAICFEDSITTLTVSVTNTTAQVSYQWQPISVGGIVSPLAKSTIVKPVQVPQQYIVTVTDGFGCNYAISDTVVVTKQPAVPAFAGNDTIVSTGLPQQLLATGGVGYLWSPGSLLNNPFIQNPVATIYADSVLLTVIVQDAAGCKGYDTVKIKTLNGVTYYVPNAFSPNGDGINDVFRPIPVGIASTELFRIFNRYGELVFETTQIMKGWDGTFKGKQQQTGNYVWILKGKSNSGKIIELKGNVLLVK